MRGWVQKLLVRSQVLLVGAALVLLVFLNVVTWTDLPAWGEISLLTGTVALVGLGVWLTFHLEPRGSRGLSWGLELPAAGVLLVLILSELMQPHTGSFLLPTALLGFPLGFLALSQRTSPRFFTWAAVLELICFILVVRDDAVDQIGGVLLLLATWAAFLFAAGLSGASPEATSRRLMAVIIVFLFVGAPFMPERAAAVPVLIAALLIAVPGTILSLIRRERLSLYLALAGLALVSGYAYFGLLLILIGVAALPRRPGSYFRDLFPRFVRGSS